jgi:hypothetical protein
MAGGQAAVFVEYFALKKYIRAILNLAVNTLVATRCERISFFFFFSLFQIPAEMQLGLVCTRLMPHGCKEDGVKPIIRNYLVDIFLNHVTKDSRVHMPKERNKPCISPCIQINSWNRGKNPK